MVEGGKGKFAIDHLRHNDRLLTVTSFRESEKKEMNKVIKEEMKKGLSK